MSFSFARAGKSFNDDFIEKFNKEEVTTKARLVSYRGDFRTYLFGDRENL